MIPFPFLSPLLRLCDFYFIIPQKCDLSSCFFAFLQHLQFVNILVLHFCTTIYIIIKNTIYGEVEK